MANRKGGSRGSTRSTTRSGDKAKAIIIAIVVILIAALFALSIGSQGFTIKNPKDYFNKWGQAASAPSKPGDSDNQDNAGTNNSTATVVGEGGAVITGYVSNGGALFRSARILKTEYEDYGVAPQSDGAFSINVVNQTEGAIDTYTWTSSNPDKVAISSVSEDTKTATIVCNGAFNTTITITATSTHDSTINASCTVDYAKRINSVTCNFTITYETEEWDDEGLPVWDTIGTENYNLNSSTGDILVTLISGADRGNLNLHSINATGSIGTIEDYNSSVRPTMRLSVVNSLKSEIQNKLGVTCNPYTIDLMSSIHKMEDIIMNVFQGATKTQVFQMIESYTNKGVSALQFEFSFVGKYTGNTYTVSCPVAFACSSFFENRGITLDPGNVIF